MSSNAATAEAIMTSPASDIPSSPAKLAMVVNNTPKKATPSKRPAWDPWSWRPRVSAPFVDRTLKLNSVWPQTSFRNLWPRLQLAAYGMSVTIPILERDKGNTVEVLEKAFTDALNDILRHQQSAIARYEALLAENAVSRSLCYDSKEERFPVYSPNANRAVALFEGLNRVAILVDELWFAGIFTTMQSKRAIHETRSQIRNFVNRMDGIWKRARAAAMKSGKPEDVASIRAAMGPVFDANLAVEEGQEHDAIEVHDEGGPEPADHLVEGMAEADTAAESEPTTPRTRRSRKASGATDEAVAAAHAE